MPKAPNASASGLGEPWSSAQRALEAYCNDMRKAPCHNCASICHKHGAILAGITKKLPKNVTPPVFDGKKQSILPASAPELAQVLVRNLENACITEIQIAPTELRGTMAQFAALVSAELSVCAMAELLDENPANNASFLEELAVADSVERINNHFNHLTEVMKSFTSDVTKAYAELDSLLQHAGCLKQFGMIAVRCSQFMNSMLTGDDPLLSPARRLKNAAESLVEAASACQTKVKLLLINDDPYFSASVKAGARSGMGRKSMIGLLAMAGRGDAGAVNLLLPSEAKRRKKVDRKLLRRRERGGGHSSDGEAEERLELDKAEAAHVQCVECGNYYKEDAVFCRKCGQQRPESPMLGKAKGPPPLKNVHQVDSDAEEDQEFLNSLKGRGKPKADAEHDVWGDKALQPSLENIAPQFLQKERIEDVSDDDEEAQRLLRQEP